MIETRARVKEVRRLLRHFDRVAIRLHARPPAGLTDTQARRRAAALRHLSRYAEERRFPTNRTRRPMTPVFVDEDGARCAMAALVDDSGERGLVVRIARAHNLATIGELAHDAELGSWLDAHGMTIEEAARIQPAYADYDEVRWQPTVAIFGSVEAGGATPIGAEMAVAPGLRAGVRRSTIRHAGGGISGGSSLGWMAEYTSTFLFGHGRSDHVAALFQLEPRGWGNIVFQTYLLGGPLLAVGEPQGLGVGGELGFGLSFRNPFFLEHLHAIPLFVEVTSQGLGFERAAAVRGGLDVGLVW